MVDSFTRTVFITKLVSNNSLTLITMKNVFLILSFLFLANVASAQIRYNNGIINDGRHLLLKSDFSEFQPVEYAIDDEVKIVNASWYITSISLNSNEVRRFKVIRFVDGSTKTYEVEINLTEEDKRRIRLLLSERGKYSLNKK